MQKKELYSKTHHSALLKTNARQWHNEITITADRSDVGRAGEGGESGERTGHEGRDPQHTLSLLNIFRSRTISKTRYNGWPGQKFAIFALTNFWPPPKGINDMSR